MQADEVAAHAKRVVTHMIQADNPGRAMLQIVKTYAEDDSISGNAMIEIFGASLVFMASSMDRTATQAISGVMRLLALLYADRPPEELARMSAAFLAGEEFEDESPRVRVVVMHMRKDE